MIRWAGANIVGTNETNTTMLAKVSPSASPQVIPTISTSAVLSAMKTWALLPVRWIQVIIQAEFWAASLLAS